MAPKRYFYFVRPENAEYVTGSAPKPRLQSSFFWFVLGFAISLVGPAFGVMLIYSALTAERNGSPIVEVCAGLFAILVGGVFCGILVYEVMRRRRLVRDGRLVEGTVLDFGVESDDEGSKSTHVHYNFVSPATGAIIEGDFTLRNSWIRRLLESTGPPPQKGDIASVLYVDDKTHTLL